MSQEEEKNRMTTSKISRFNMSKTVWNAINRNNTMPFFSDFIAFEYSFLVEDDRKNRGGKLILILSESFSFRVLYSY